MKQIDLTDTAYLVTGRLPDYLTSDYVIRDLKSIRPEKVGQIKLRSKLIPTPRYQRNYIRNYSFAGLQHQADVPLPDILSPFLSFCNTLERDAIGAHGNNSFNQLLVNWYLNGNHYIGAHSDDVRQLQCNSPIFSASLGQERVFRIRDKITKKIVLDLPMKHGTYLVMCGTFQKYFTHEVPKVSGAKGQSMETRINITCRMFTDHH